MTTEYKQPKVKYRTLFISDIHLGSAQSKSYQLLQFLKKIEVEQIYLVGDFIDFLAMKRKGYWTRDCNLVIRRLLRLSKHNVGITYIIGNHDIALKDLEGENLGGILIRRKDVHYTADGKKLKVLHGDQFDGIFATKMPIFYYLGDVIYALLLWLNRASKTFLSIIGKKEFSLSHYIKTNVKNVVEFVKNYEELVAMEAKKEGYDGVIAGHIHKAELRETRGIIYGNCGCWTDCMTYLVEHMDGRLEMKSYEFDPSEKINEEVSVCMDIMSHQTYYKRKPLNVSEKGTY